MREREQDQRFALVLREDSQHPVFVDLVRTIPRHGSVCCTHAEFHLGSLLVKARRGGLSRQPRTPDIKPFINLTGGSQGRVLRLTGLSCFPAAVALAADTLRLRDY